VTQRVVPVGHVEPLPRRIRATVGGRTVLDTTRALYHWDKPQYPRYLVPLEDASVEGDPTEVEGYVHVPWQSVDAWFEEDEQVHVHPRDPYTRVDVLRSSRHVRVELDGVLLAESRSPLLLFETGLPTRYYLDKSAIDFTRLEPADTVTACPYKGTTTEWWSFRSGDELHRNVAWSYGYPSREVLPIAGLVAFYNEKVELFLDGERG
jgi:uncharacterized protein (DUF427 family)